jgi:hypothetical protein
MVAPELSPSAILRTVEKLADPERKRTFIAIYGRGEPDRVQLATGGGTVEIVPVRSELELREKLPPLGSSPYRAFLVPFAGMLPEDIGGRFLGNGKIERVGREQQLAALVGASTSTSEAANTELAVWLLRTENPTKSYAFSGQKLDVDDLFELWLETDWGLPRGGLALDALLSWAAKDARGGEFTKTLNTEAGARVLAELIAHLQKKLGLLGPAIFSAWTRGSAAQLLGFAVLAEVLSEIEDGSVRMWLRQALKNLLELPANADGLGIAKQLGGLTRPVLAWLGRRDDSSAIERSFIEAEKLADEREIRVKLIASHRLPLAWTLRLEELNAAFLQVTEKRDRPSLKLAEDAWRNLEKHEYFQRPDQTRIVGRAEMAVRLATWLVIRPDQDLFVPEHSYGAVEALGTWYAENGGFLDWARRSVRALTTGPLTGGSQSLVAAVDEERARLDRRFSEGLANWIYAGRPGQNLLPIDKALERIAARFLKQSEDRKLLVLLMDGMAWAQAVELLPSLADGGRRWGPIAWTESPQNRIGPGRYPVMLAALPTVTEVSRSAFFAGALVKNGTSLNTAKDPEYFGANKHMVPFVESHLKPKLMLRGDGHTNSGALTEEARQMILAAGEQRVVAMVVNAIDASLKGDSQHEHSWKVESIRSLPQILEEARAAGRHVLMVADHGHVPADRLKNIGPGHGGGARYRRWSGSVDVLADGERKFSGEGVYLPKGDEAVVLLEDDGTRYGGAAHAGEHGGSSMAEVIAPCVLLGWDDAFAAEQDRDLKVRAPYVPDWWTRTLAEERKQAVDRSEAAPKRKKKVSENQTSFTGLEPVAPPPSSKPSSSRSPSERPSRPPKGSELLPVLYESEMLRARSPEADLRQTVVKAVHFLLARPGGVHASAFASHLGIPAFRVPGQITRLQEVLNLDGYEIIRFERTHQQIFLDKVKLEQQFEVKL